MDAVREAMRRAGPVGDVLLAAALTLLVLAEIWLSPAPDPDELPITGLAGVPWASSAAAIAFTLSLAWRRRMPGLPLALAFPALALSATASLDAALALTLACMLATYSAGCYSSGRGSVLAGLAVGGLVVLAIVRVGVGIEEPSDVVLPLSLLGGPWLVGVALRERREREAVLRERTVLLEREQTERARTAVAEERARIAREMHDIVAHALTVTILQARGARRSLPDDPGSVRIALDAIESTGSEALAQLRHLLGVLRPDEAPRSPESGLAELDDLVARLDDAGLHVELDVQGEPADLAPMVDRAAYRIIQEALTNVLRHAGSTHAVVRVDCKPDRLDLVVRDDGATVGRVGDSVAASRTDGQGAAGPPERAAGRGIAGMRERAASVGGSLEAGPDPAGGYLVRASLPRTQPA